MKKQCPLCKDEVQPFYMCPACRGFGVLEVTPQTVKNKRRQERTLKQAVRDGRKYTSLDMKYLTDENMSSMQVALKTHRTLRAVEEKRRRMRKEAEKKG